MTADMILSATIGFIIGTWFGMIIAALMDANRK